MSRLKKFLRSLAVILLIGGIVLFLLIRWSFEKVSLKEPRIFGVTYVAGFAEKFGMDRREVFLAILDELKAKYLRIPVYWDEAEPEDDHYDFSEVDWQLQEAERRVAKVILAIGRKLPRWPECHEPPWVKSQNQDSKSQKLLEHLEVVVNRYKDHPALSRWQVENEPFLPFGEDCLLFGGGFLDRELELVKRLDAHHPIVVTDSGELSIWVRALKRADIFGTTMYRRVWNENLGYFTYPLPPGFFRVKRAIAEFFVGPKPMFVSELQLEPWGPKLLYETPLEESLSRFGTSTFRENIEYAKKSGFDEFYLWGVEWSYWLKLQGHPEMWEEARKIIQSVP